MSCSQWDGSGCSTFVLTTFSSFRLFNISRRCAAETSCGTPISFGKSGISTLESVIYDFFPRTRVEIWGHSQVFINWIRMPPKFTFSIFGVKYEPFWLAHHTQKTKIVKLHEATHNRSFYFGKFPYKLLETNPHLYTTAHMHLLSHPCLSKSEYMGVRSGRLGQDWTSSNHRHLQFPPTNSLQVGKFLGGTSTN
jgi:hypothetical protein